MKKRVASDDWETPKWILELMFPNVDYFDPCPLNGPSEQEQP